jgi:hypothetical protein
MGTIVNILHGNIIPPEEIVLRNFAFRIIVFVDISLPRRFS